MFVYLAFIWNVFKHLSSIIKGSGAGSGHIEMIRDDIYAGEVYRRNEGGK